MGLGIITGREIAKNGDGEKERLILQVQFTADDVRPVEMVAQAGEDTNPADGCRVMVLEADKSYKIVVAVTDDLLPECEPGEKEIYSTDSPATAKLARIKLNKNSEIVINQGEDFAVRFSKLKEVVEEIQDIITALQDALSNWIPVPQDGGASLTAVGLASWLLNSIEKNIDDSKVEEVKLP